MIKRKEILRQTLYPSYKITKDKCLSFLLTSLFVCHMSILNFITIIQFYMKNWLNKTALIWKKKEIKIDKIKKVDGSIDHKENIENGGRRKQNPPKIEVCLFSFYLAFIRDYFFFYHPCEDLFLLLIINFI